MYTALSRVKTLDGLFFIDGFDQKKVKCDKKAQKEMERMISCKKFILRPPNTLHLPHTLYLKLSLLNINSIRFHFGCLQKDTWLTQSHLIALTETWLSARDDTYQYAIKDYQMTRRDSSNQAAGGGVANYIHSLFYIVWEFQIDMLFECSAVIMEHRAYGNCIILLITVYNKPSNSTQDFFRSIGWLTVTAAN